MCNYCLQTKLWEGNVSVLFLFRGSHMNVTPDALGHGYLSPRPWYQTWDLPLSPPRYHTLDLPHPPLVLTSSDDHRNTYGWQAICILLECWLVGFTSGGLTAHKS